MRLEIRLGDADRQRLGCPEWLTYDEEALTIGDLIALEEATGLTLLQLNVGIRTSAATATKAVYWWALRNAGITVDYDAFTFAPFASKFRVADPGKENSGQNSTDSAPSSPATSDSEETTSNE